MSESRNLPRRAVLASMMGATAAGLATPVIAQGIQEWKMTTAWSKGTPILWQGCVDFAKRVEAVTEGKIRIKVYAAGEIVPAFEALDAVSSGTVELASDNAYYYIGKSKAMAFFGAVPFGMTANEVNGWLYHGGGQELYDELFAQFGVKPFITTNSGPQMAGWFRNEINSIADFKGLKYRMPGLGAEVIKKVGGVPLLLPGGEIFSNLQSGAIDASEFVSPYIDLAMGFYKVAPYYYFPAFHEPGTLQQIHINLDLFNQQADSVKQIIAAAATEQNMLQFSEFNYRNAAALRTLIKEHEVKLRQLPTDVIMALGAASGEVLQELLDSDDPMTKRIAESYTKARTEAMAWTRIGDQAYSSARNLDFKFPKL